MPKVLCICLVCSAPFTVYPSAIASGEGKYCSQRCYHHQRRDLPTSCICAVCSTSFPVARYKIRQGGGKYCSQACYHKSHILPLAERFWSFVLKTDTYWLWQGGRNSNGYGHFTLTGKQQSPSHRVAFELTYGMILPGLFCCHHCDTPLCVRPDHLFLGTHTDNMRDMAHKGRTGGYIKVPISGEHNFNAKLTESKVREMRHLRAIEGWTYARLATYFGVTDGTVGKVIARTAWKHVS